MDTTTIARRLAEERRRAGLTQDEVARRAGVTFATVSRWESGVRTPTLDNVVAWAGALGGSAHLTLVLPGDAGHEAALPLPGELQATVDRLASALPKLPPERRDDLLSLLEVYISRVEQ